MSLNSQANAYKSAALENAPPLKIVRMLYHGCLRFIDRAVACHGEGDLPKFNYNIGKAEAIVSELRSSLIRENAPAMVEQLEGLYLFVFGRFIEAIASGETQSLAEARDVIEILLDAWNELELSQGQ